MYRDHGVTMEPGVAAEHVETVGLHPDGSDYGSTYQYADQHHSTEHWVEPVL